MQYFIIIKEHLCQIYATSSRPSPAKALAERGCSDNRGFWCDVTDSNELPYEYMLTQSDEATSWQPFVRPDRQAGTSIVRSSTVTRHAAPMGQCTGPHLSVGSIYYNAEVYPYSVWRAPPERGGLPTVQWVLHPS